MRILLILLAMIWIVAGVLMFIFTDAFKEVMRNLLKQKKFKLFAVLSFLVGVILMLGSSVVNAPWVAVLFGVLAIAKGVFFMFGPKKKADELISWWLNASNNAYKVWSIAAFLFGVILLLIL
ncbi:MAG: hypothetical protein HQ575_00625 [Candidatus Omnitrophica bacterium]|nr:hypothetical protein [Candidatus Omnitrophota bacterium]